MLATMLSAPRARSSAVPFLSLLLLTSSAHAEDHCDGVNGHFCNLGSYLHTLYVLAALLAAILIVVIVLAIAYYRKAQRTKLEP